MQTKLKASSSERKILLNKIEVLKSIRLYSSGFINYQTFVSCASTIYYGNVSIKMLQHNIFCSSVA